MEFAPKISAALWATSVPSSHRHIQSTMLDAAASYLFHRLAECRCPVWEPVQQPPSTHIPTIPTEEEHIQPRMVDHGTHSKWVVVREGETMQVDRRLLGPGQCESVTVSNAL